MTKLDGEEPDDVCRFCADFQDEKGVLPEDQGVCMNCQSDHFGHTLAGFHIACEEKD